MPEPYAGPSGVAILRKPRCGFAFGAEKALINGFIRNADLVVGAMPLNSLRVSPVAQSGI